MKITTLHDLFIHELRDLYSAKQQVIKALPKMIKSTHDEGLSSALSEHLDITREQLARLEQINSEIPFMVKADQCMGMKGVLSEGDKTVSLVSDSATRDAAIIAVVQRVEHYEIAAYGAAVSFAREMGHNEAADLLQQILDEEADMSEKLTGLAEGGLLTGGINELAHNEGV